MDKKWLVIAISGVTCGGKTTLASAIHNIIPNSEIISQDDYFLDVSDPRHTWIPDLNHINFDIISSLDMEKMTKDVQNILKKPLHSNTGNGYKTLSNCTFVQSLQTQDIVNLRSEIIQILVKNQINVLIVEGFCLLNYKPIASLCNLCYFITLDRDECLKRRLQRVYEPPDCPGYFDKCAWPCYLKQMEEVRLNVKNVKYLNGSSTTPIEIVLQDIKDQLSNL